MTTFTEVPYYDVRERDVAEVQFPINRLELEVVLPPLRRLIEEYAKAFDALPEFVVEKTLRPIRDLYDRLEEALAQLKGSEHAAQADTPAAPTPASEEPVAVGAIDADDIPF